MMLIGQLEAMNLITDFQLWPEVRQSPPLVNINKLYLAICVAPIGDILFNGSQEYD